MNREFLSRSRVLGIAITATLTALVVFGELAVAATFGGITGTGAGADGTVPASCDTDGVTTRLAPAWDAIDKRFEITSVTFAGVSNACDGQAVSVILTDSAGAQIGSGSVAIPTSAATSHIVTLSAAPSAERMAGLHVVISS